jgi:transcriptional regulator with XRE-family HTH domain/Skp family chaperone for outer membrane proteins
LKFNIPERSRLYNLEPIGIGTTEVESFSGYISRLAQEHSVSPLVLIRNSVTQSEQLPQVLAQNSLPATAAANLNGFNETAEKLVDIFCKATFRKDIQSTTLLVWKNKISHHGLLRKNLAWCPSCFQEQLETTGMIYEKLIWTFEVVGICSIHQTNLCEVCPYCQRKLKVLSGKSRPGFCSKCLRWLGLKNISGDSETNSKELWITLNVGKFLLVSSQITNSFSNNLNRLAQQVADGNINDFAYLTGVWHLSIRRLLKGEVLPTLEMLIDICYPLNFSPVDLFVADTKSNEIVSDLPGEIKKHTKEEVRLKLSAYLAENPAPSANEVARQIGWRTTRFQRNFPDEYKQIVERYLQHQSAKLPDFTDEEIEEVLSNAIVENPPPSLQSIFRKIGCRNTGYRYYSRFPALCKQISIRYQKANQKQFDIENVEQVLKFALKEKPTPSFSEIARRLKCSRNILSKKLSKLSAKLHKKYESDLKEVREQNKQAMYKEIIRVINELENQQKSVTENAVRKRLNRKWNDKNFKTAYKEIREN